MTGPMQMVRAYEYRCPGRRPDGRPCRKLLLKGNPGGDFTLKCPRCERILRYRDLRADPEVVLAGVRTGR